MIYTILQEWVNIHSWYLVSFAQLWKHLSDKERNGGLIFHSWYLVSFAQLCKHLSDKEKNGGGNIWLTRVSGLCVLNILLCCCCSGAACSNYWCITCGWCFVAGVLLALTAICCCCCINLLTCLLPSIIYLPPQKLFRFLEIDGVIQRYMVIFRFCGAVVVCTIW